MDQSAFLTQFVHLHSTFSPYSSLLLPFILHATMEDPEFLSPNPHLKLNDSTKHSKMMEMLKNRVLRAANSDPKRVLTPPQIALLHQRLLHACPSLHLPTHPPYAAMIQNAVQELIKENSVSDEAAISEYIKRTYTGLPWAHKRYLSHHLKKLCDAGELLLDHSDGNYISPGKRMPGNCEMSPGKRKLQRKSKDVMVEGGVEVGEELAEVIDNQVGVQEDENQPNSVRRGKRRRRSVVVDEEEDEVGEAVVVEGGNLELIDPGTCNENNDLVLKVQKSIAEQQAVGCEGESDLLERDRCEVKSVVVSSTMVECDGEVTTGVLQSGDGNSGANMMIVPYEGAKESGMDSDVNCNTSVALQLAPAVDHTFASVWNVENGVTGSMATDAVLKGNEHDNCDNKLALVPFEGGTLNSVAVRPSKWITRFMDVQIVCALPCQSLDSSKVHPKLKEKPKQKQKQEVSLRRCRPKISQVKAKLLTEQQVLPIRASPKDKGLETKGSSSSMAFPPWLEPLLGTAFFHICRIHGDPARNKCNMFCLDCHSDAFCYYCKSSTHIDHHVIQIRRSSYHDVVKVEDVQKIMDISGVQSYVINSARVMFLNQRPQKTGKGVLHTCEICGRSLLDPFRFCSLGCKVFWWEKHTTRTLEIEMGVNDEKEGDRKTKDG